MQPRRPSRLEKSSADTREAHFRGIEIENGVVRAYPAKTSLMMQIRRVIANGNGKLTRSLQIEPGGREMRKREHFADIIESVRNGTIAPFAEESPSRVSRRYRFLLSSRCSLHWTLLAEFDRKSSAPIGAAPRSRIIDLSQADYR